MVSSSSLFGSSSETQEAGSFTGSDAGSAGALGSTGDTGRTHRGAPASKDKPLYMISVAAELTGMHPQTLRVYEQKGLINPGRSRGNTRLYSQHDIERLNLIGKLTDEGINLAGVIRILDMSERENAKNEQIDALSARVRELEDEVHEFKMREKITALTRYEKTNPEKVMRGLLTGSLDDAPDDDTLIPLEYGSAQKPRETLGTQALPEDDGR